MPAQYRGRLFGASCVCPVKIPSSLPLQLPRERERVLGARRNAGPIEHLDELPRVELIDDFGPSACIPIRFVHSLHVCDERVVVGAPPGVRVAAEPFGEDFPQPIAVPAEHFLVIEHDSGQVEQDVHSRRVPQPEGALKFVRTTK